MQNSKQGKEIKDQGKYQKKIRKFSQGFVQHLGHMIGINQREIGQKVENIREI